MTTWRPSAAALDLLETSTLPTTRLVVRRALAAAEPAWSEASVGAVAGDGTRAALPLLRHADGRAVGLPFLSAGVLADRPLGAAEWRALLELAQRQTRSRSVTVRGVAWGDPSGRHVGGRVCGWTPVVRTTGPAPVEQRLSYKARRAVRAARAAGATTCSGADPSAFLDLYLPRSAAHWWSAPPGLVRDLAEDGAARVHEVRLEGRTVAAVLVLTGATHRVAWLAAQDEDGRRVQANYLALADVLEDARQAGVRAVDLVPSTGLAGVAHFKDRFNAVMTPLVEYATAGSGSRLRRVTAAVRQRRVRE